ncbi:MAG: hypothetical protein EPN85_10500 [Bacteroidetes bacterium]|nr:MAG: hypothetical protein EPN85_10500 [Bacteroidota bacterium]
MIKYAILLLNMLAIIVARVFFAGDITVKMEVPSKVKQGEEITVSLTINKGSIAGVGHMKQELPIGFSGAVVTEAKGAEFKYLTEDNVIKFTWISLPADQEFTVSYKITVNADAPNGTVNLGGKFSYVLNNEKQTFLVPGTSIIIGGEVLATTVTQPETTAVITTQPETTATTITQPEIIAVTTTQQPETTATTVSQPETTVVTTTQPETTAVTTTKPETTTPTTTEAKTTYPVTASRTIVGSPEAGMEFTVEINVKKDGMKGFARIQEILPAGLTALSLDNKGGTFSFIDQKVKIIWDNLPADEEVKISYRVSASENTSGDMTITGSFSYVENDDPKKTEIAATTISVKAKTVTATTTATEPPNTTAAAEPNNTNATVTNTTTSVPTPEDKIAYKIQICALSKMQRGTSYFESKFAIGKKVSMEFHEGWKKYIVGKYDQYKDARDYRESVRSKGVENPFVTAYNSGKRITVQEALMVSNQQWIR